MKKHSIVNVEMGVETLAQTAEVFYQPKHNFYNLFLSLSGIRKDGVSCATFSTPASSFFVPIVESRGKSLKNTYAQGGRLMPYAHIAEELRTAVRYSRRVALRATKGMTANRKKDFNRIYAETLTANVLTVAEEMEDKKSAKNGGAK